MNSEELVFIYLEQSPLKSLNGIDDVDEVFFFKNK